MSIVVIDSGSIHWIGYPGFVRPRFKTDLSMTVLDCGSVHWIGFPGFVRSSFKTE